MKAFVMEEKLTLNLTSYEAILFDMDGVLTATAKVHSACWKRMFDEFLQKQAAKKGEDFVPFEIATDYKKYVDGKKRYDGVRSFLQSRQIELPEGSPDSPPDELSVCGLGNKKNILIHEVLNSDGVEVYEGSLKLVQYLREQKIPLAVVSSSNNCEAILRAGGINDLFDTRVDGTVAAELHLAGKPAPDMFIQAAKNLGAQVSKSVVVEDAISGVEAGRNGNFGLVIGVSRDDDPETLLKHGAKYVVSDLGELLP